MKLGALTKTQVFSRQNFLSIFFVDKIQLILLNQDISLYAVGRRT